MTGPKTSVINIRVSDVTRKRIKVLAATLEVTQGELVERAVAALERELSKGAGHDTK